MGKESTTSRIRGKVGKLYDYPHYYEIAFSFRDISKEVDIFEECIKRFSGIPVKNMLELACGSAPHMPELVRRGYSYIGLDLNDVMLDFARRRVSEKYKAELLNADMLDFKLPRRVDFAFILLGSLYAANTSELTSHFDTVARALQKGGLYFLDWCVEFESLASKNPEDTWVIERDGITIRTNVSYEPLSNVEQTFVETITLEVDDYGKRRVIREESVRRAIYPQEFLRIIDARKDFEFVGWWNNWELEYPLKAWPSSVKIDRPIVVIRRK